MSKKPLPVLMPSEVSSRVGFFDRFVGPAAKLANPRATSSEAACQKWR